MSLKNFYLSSLLIILIAHIFVHKNFNKKLKQHTKIAEHENYEITENRKLNASAELKANEISRIKKETDILLKKIELETNKIKSKTQEMMGEEKIQFILSDFFYNSTDWKKIRQKAFEIHINKCSFCSTTINLTVDHILPRSKFPEKALEVSNTQILCLSCNSSKGNKLIK
jgi:5-methylcytosine-specific restriction endonuclease McrA